MSEIADAWLMAPLIPPRWPDKPGKLFTIVNIEFQKGRGLNLEC